LQWLILVLGLEFPVALALLDCVNRSEEHFEGGADDRQAWVRWLAMAVVLAPVLLGYGIVLAYFYAVVKRNAPGRI
jgi:hypothetical protein